MKSLIEHSKYGKDTPNKLKTFHDKNTNESVNDRQVVKHYNDHHKAISKMLDRMSNEHNSKDNRHLANNGKAHWGHVGDIAHKREKLQDIHDSMFHEGEYAKDK